MKFGFIKVMAASPKLKVGDTAYNLESARECFDEAERVGANLLVFPELHLTAYTCGDLFYSDTLLDGALEALEALAAGRISFQTMSSIVCASMCSTLL